MILCGIISGTNWRKPPWSTKAEFPLRWLYGDL